MSLRLIITRPYKYEDDIADLKNRVYIDLMTELEIKTEVRETMEGSIYLTQGIDHMLICDMLICRDTQNLGDGDLFESHQIAPLAAVLYALGVTDVSKPRHIATLLERARDWDNIHDMYKFFEIFGETTLARAIHLVAHLVGKHWDFKVQENGETIPNTTDAAFRSKLTNKEQTV